MISSAMLVNQTQSGRRANIRIEYKDWNDIIDMWPGITYVHACMYLILNPSPYTKEDMLNYKSLDSYRIFQDGWVREVLVKEMNQKKVDRHWKGENRTLPACFF